MDDHILDEIIKLREENEKRIIESMFGAKKAAELLGKDTDSIGNRKNKT